MWIVLGGLIPAQLFSSEWQYEESNTVLTELKALLLSAINSPFVMTKKYFKIEIPFCHSAVPNVITWSTLYCLDRERDKIWGSLMLSAKLLTSLAWFCDIHFDDSIYLQGTVALFWLLGAKCNMSRNFVGQLFKKP